MNDKTKTAGTNAPAKPTRADLEAALANLPGQYRDPDYVVDGMRGHYGDLFTAADEAKVRELVKPTASGGSGGAGQTNNNVQGGAGTAGTLGQVAQWKKATGNRVKVLDWSKDPQAPVECDATITKVHDNGTIDVDVHPPVGIEPYRQEGLTESTIGHMRPGQWSRP